MRFRITRFHRRFTKCFLPPCSGILVRLVVIFGCLSGAIFNSIEAASKEELIAERDGLAAYVQLRANGLWCGRQLKIRLRGNEVFDFRIDDGPLVPLIEQVRNVIRTSCPQNNIVRLFGFAGDRRVYNGVIQNMIDGGTLIHRSMAKELTAAKVAPQKKDGAQIPISSTMTDTGRLITARTLGDQCVVINSWIGRLYSEYPGLHSIRSRRDLMSKVTNLFGDLAFYPVFGRTYDEVDELFSEFVLNQLYRQCPRNGHLGQRVTTQIIKGAFGGESRTGDASTLRIAVVQGREDREWLELALASLAEIPNTEVGYTQLEELINNSAERIATLWPSEQPTYLDKLHERRVSLAFDLAELEIADLPVNVESLSYLDAALRLTRERVDDRAPNALQALNKQALEKRRTLRIAILDAEIAAINASPARLAELSSLVTRRRRFLAQFGEGTSPDELAQYNTAIRHKARAIAESGLMEFDAALSELPETQLGAMTAIESFEIVVSDLQAVAPQFIEPYQRAATTRVETIHAAIIENAERSIMEHEVDWINAAALITLAKQSAAAFQGTASAARANQLVDLARARARRIVTEQEPSFISEIEGIPTSWDGLDALHRHSEIVAEQEGHIAAFSGYRQALDQRIASMVENLFEMALADIKSTGRDEQDWEKVLDKTNELAARFKTAGDNDKAHRLRQAGDQRIEAIGGAPMTTKTRQLTVTTSGPVNADGASLAQSQGLTPDSVRQARQKEIAKLSAELAKVAPLARTIPSTSTVAAAQQRSPAPPEARGFIPFRWNPLTHPRGPTLGAVAGHHIDQAIQGLHTAQRSVQSLNSQIDSARRQFWRCAMDCAELEPRARAYGQALFEKDFHYAGLDLVDTMTDQSGNASMSFRVLAGEIDGGIPQHCRVAHRAWSSCLAKGLYGNDDMEGALVQCEPVFAKYVPCRNAHEYTKRYASKMDFLNPLTAALAWQEAASSSPPNWNTAELQVGLLVNEYGAERVRNAAIIALSGPALASQTDPLDPGALGCPDIKPEYRAGPGSWYRCFETLLRTSNYTEAAKRSLLRYDEMLGTIAAKAARYDILVLQEYGDQQAKRTFERNFKTNIAKICSQKYEALWPTLREDCETDYGDLRCVSGRRRALVQAYTCTDQGELQYNPASRYEEFKQQCTAKWGQNSKESRICLDQSLASIGRRSSRSGNSEYDF